MENIAAKAIENHAKGMNCCQAVACAFASQYGVDENTVFMVGEGFGAGMGGLNATCGAVSGAVIAAGMKNSSRDIGQPGTKRSTYQLTNKIIRAFEEKNGSLICKELKGTETGKVLRTCSGCIEDAAAIAAEILEGQE